MPRVWEHHCAPNTDGEREEAREERGKEGGGEGEKQSEGAKVTRVRPGMLDKASQLVLLALNETDV